MSKRLGTELEVVVVIGGGNPLSPVAKDHLRVWSGTSQA